MAVKIITTNSGRNIYLHRGNTVSPSSTQYLPLTQVQYGVNGSQPVIGSTSIDNAIPISDGTVLDDGSNTFTGTSGGDNSTNNTSTYTEGAGVSDITAQNLIKNNGNTTAIWTIANLASAGTNATATSLTGLYFYILNATTLAKFVSSGTALEIKLGSDASNYYSKTYTAATLTVGWNWLNLGQLDSLTETGTVSGNIDTYIIEVTTNNATDTFVAGEVIVDLLRQWVLADTKSGFTSGYPTFNYTTNEVTRQHILTTTQANGFLLNNIAFVNQDTTPLYGMIALITADSKSSTDQWRVTNKERII